MNGIEHLIREQTSISLEKGGNHYKWGEDCDGWILVEEPSLSVKLEKMPARTAEQKHYHEKANQFFFVLKGEAIFEVERERITVKQEQGIFIEAGKQHRILNESNKDLEFILSSQPSTAGDRINIE